MFKYAAITSLWINIMLMACLSSIFVGCWYMMMAKFENRVKACKDVINLLPAIILTQNMRVNKFMQVILIDNINGFV